MSSESAAEADALYRYSSDVFCSAWGPASLSNLGPGFDVLGVAVQGLGDRVSVRVLDDPQFRVRILGPEWVADLPTNEELNTAAVAARRVFRSVDIELGAEVSVYKGIPLGSGIGGSAASAVAGAVAAAEAIRMLTGEHVPLDVVVQCALAGERIASGAVHGDNVIPALIGGVCLVDPTNPRNYNQLDVLGDCEIVLLLPSTRVLTKAARAILPDSVRLSSAAAQAHRLANMLDALMNRDWMRAGSAMMSDELVEPYRAPHVTGYDLIRDAALEAGAFACCLTGSGPAMFSLVSPGSGVAVEVGQAMLGPLRRQNGTARVVCTRVEKAGARIVVSDHEESHVIEIASA